MRMALLALVCAVLHACSGAEAAECSRSGDRCRENRCGRPVGSGHVAAHFDPGFAFAPVSGAGLGAACLCDAGITSAQGDALTFSRSSVAECISQDGQTITQCPSGVPRVMTGAVDDSQLGLAIENTARTNVIDDSRNLAAASWTKTNMTCTHTAAGMRGGDANGASRCTASADGGSVLAVTGEAAGAFQCFTGYVHPPDDAGFPVGPIYPTVDGTTLLADITPQLVAGKWKRIVPAETLGCMAVAGGASNCIVRAGLMDAPLTPKLGFVFGHAGDVLDIDFTQGERCPDFRASTPIATSGGNATRAAELADVALSVSFASQYCFAGTFIQTAYSNTGTGGWAPVADQRWIGVPGDRNPGVSTGSAAYVDSYYDRTVPELASSTTQFSPALVVHSKLVWDGGTRLRGVSYWDMTNADTCIDGHCGVQTVNPLESVYDDGGVFYTALPATRYRLSNYDATHGMIDGVIKHVEADARAAVCQRFLSSTPTTYGAALGDSITCCPTATVVGWWDEANRLYSATSRLQIVSLAKGSAFTGSNSSNATANNLLWQWENYARGKGYSTLFVLGGINDIKSGLDMDQAYANLKQIWDEARADRLRLVLMTLSPAGSNAGWNGTRQTKLTTLNAQISAYCVANGATCIDLYTPDVNNGGLRVADGGTSLDALVDSGDGLHPNAVGEARIAALITAKVP